MGEGGCYLGFIVVFLSGEYGNKLVVAYSPTQRLATHDVEHI
jgi:hypothetical protein